MRTDIDQLVDHDGQRTSAGERQHRSNSPAGPKRAQVRRAPWGRLRFQEHYGALRRADFDSVWRIGGHDHLGAAMLVAVLVTHRERCCCGDNLDGMVGV